MSGEFTDLFAVAACGAVVAVAEAVTIPLSCRAIIDVPGHRSSHPAPSPGGGGIPIAAGLLVAAVRIAADPQQRQAVSRQGRCYVERYFGRATLNRQDRKLLDASGGRR
jgi:hypothetical protein